MARFRLSIVPATIVPVFELKVVGLEELELDGDALLGGELMELRGGGHTDPLGGREHRQLLLLDRPVLGVGQRLYTEYPKLEFNLANFSTTLTI